VDLKKIFLFFQSLLEIGASTASYQESVSGKDTTLILDHIGHAAICVSRSGQSINHMGAEIYAIPFIQVTIRLGSTGGSNHRLTPS